MLKTGSTVYPNYNLAFLLYDLGPIGSAINETEVEEINNPPNETRDTAGDQTFYFTIPEGSIVFIVSGIFVVIGVALIALIASREKIKGPEIQRKKSKKESRPKNERKKEREGKYTQYEF